MSRPTIPFGALCALLAALLIAAPVVAGTGPALPSRLVELRAAHHAGFDRLVLQFSGPVPSTHEVRWTDQLWWDSAGPDRRAWVSGNAFLRVRLFPVLMEEVTPATADRAFDLPEVVEARRIGDWEGVQTWGIGLMRRTSLVRVTTLSGPSRLVIDIAAPGATRRAPVLFLDRAVDRWTWVTRSVPLAGNATTRARDVLRRLFAGPTPAERASGLRLVRDHVVGFRALSVSDTGVARLTLVGACDAGGDARTLGPELLRSLRQVAGVRWVRVFDEHGETRHPSGPGDSLPDCLVPAGGSR